VSRPFPPRYHQLPPRPTGNPAKGSRKRFCRFSLAKGRSSLRQGGKGRLGRPTTVGAAMISSAKIQAGFQKDFRHGRRFLRNGKEDGPPQDREKKIGPPSSRTPSANGPETKEGNGNHHELNIGPAGREGRENQRGRQNGVARVIAGRGPNGPGPVGFTMGPSAKRRIFSARRTKSKEKFLSPAPALKRDHSRAKSPARPSKGVNVQSSRFTISLGRWAPGQFRSIAGGFASKQ